MNDKGGKAGKLGTVINIIGQTFETLDLKVGWTGSGVWLQKRRSKTVLHQMSDAEIEREIEEDLLPYIPVDKQKGFLITAKDVEKQVLRILRKLVPEVEWISTHYWEARGLNDFEDCDFGLAYGFAFKNVSKLEDNARTIFGGDTILRKRWCSQQNHNEHYQTAERLRLTRNPGRTLVVIGPLYPIEHLGTPTEIIDLWTLGILSGCSNPTYLLSVLESGHGLDCILGGTRQSDLAFHKFEIIYANGHIVLAHPEKATRPDDGVGDGFVLCNDEVVHYADFLIFVVINVFPHDLVLGTPSLGHGYQFSRRNCQGHAANHRRLLLGERIPHHPNHCQTNHHRHNFSVHFVFSFS